MGRPIGLTAVALAAFVGFASASPAAAGVPAREPSLRNQCGINAHLPTEQDFARMEKLGVGWARVDLTWDFVEPEPGRYRWGVIDQVVAGAESHGIRLLGILGYCPEWASSGPDPYYPPRNQAQWMGFVATIVSRYRGCITHWTLWNEPNNEGFFHGTCEQYIHKVLIPGSLAAKTVAPECRIVGPDLAHLRSAHWDRWLDTILREAGSHIDIIGHHCYRGDAEDVWRALGGPTRPWEPRSVLEIVRRAGQRRKPLWLTEVGWRSNRIGEADQARQALALLGGLEARPWVRKVFFFELRDSTRDLGYGFLREDGSPKPVFGGVRRWLEAREAGAGRASEAAQTR